MTITMLTAPTVRLDDDQVAFDNFIDSDRHVVDAIGAAVDPEACAHELLQLGARLAGLAAGTGGLVELEARVGARLDALAGATQSTVAAGLASLADQSHSLFAADEGEVSLALRAWRSDLDRHLGELFDPEHKASLIAGMEHSMAEVLDAYARRLMASTDPDVPDSAASRLVAQVSSHVADLKGDLAALTLAVGVQRGRSEEHLRSAVKGLEFEPLVLEALTGITAPHGDVVEHVGRTSGVKGTKKGDIRVTLSDEDVAGSCGHYIIEAKDRELTLAATCRELDAAMGNWEAAAGVAVFAASDLAPTDLPFWHSGDRAIVVLDRDDPDPSALTLACLFARWVVRRRMAPSATGPDPERMAAGIDRIQRALARVSTIRRSLSTSAKATGEARGQLDELAAEVRAALTDLSAELEA